MCCRSHLRRTENDATSCQLVWKVLSKHCFYFHKNWLQQNTRTIKWHMVSCSISGQQQPGIILIHDVAHTSLSMWTHNLLVWLRTTLLQPALLLLLLDTATSWLCALCTSESCSICTTVRLCLGRVSLLSTTECEWLLDELSLRDWWV